MKFINSLATDFYQVTMMFVCLVSGKANERTGFEAFVRHVKPEINPNKDVYVFKGEKEVISFMKKVKEEIQSPEFIEAFKELILPKIPEIKRDFYENVIDREFKKVSKDFDFSVAKENSFVRPLVPVFQYSGAKFFGQPIETMILSIINGKTGAATYNAFGEGTSEEKMYVDLIAGNRTSIAGYNASVFKSYFEQIEKEAARFREATTKPVFEAAFRRAPSFDIAYKASQIALKNGWNATSNTSLFFNDDASIDVIGGTMAHAFIMSFEKEVDAFRVWNDIFPNNTILVDTYDTINAVKTLISENIKPDTVRIDSGDLASLCVEVRKILDDAGWNDVKIFISGDLTPEIIKDFEEREIPFDKLMAGTKFVNVGYAKYTNAGFVYKLVETEINGQVLYPEKKAEGKKNYPGLKTVSFCNGKIKVSIEKDSFGFDENVFKNETKEMEVVFDF